MPLHPTLVNMIEAIRQSGRPQLSDGSPEDARALVAATREALGRGPEVGSTSTLRIATRKGSIPGRLYQPVKAAQGLVVYFHGGGWVAGALDDFDALARTLASRSNCAVLLADYRLAPEHPFPAGLHDAEDTLLWASSQCAALLGKDLPLMVAGDSAGANLAIVATLSLKADVKPGLQVLFYPVTDDDTDTPSYLAYGTDYPLTKNDMKWFFRHYAGGHATDDPRISPLRSSNLSCAPDTWIATAEYDVLRDQGEAFAESLIAAGVTVQMQRYAGMTHGFARMMNLVDTADQAISDAAAAMSRHCAAQPLQH